MIWTDLELRSLDAASQKVGRRLVSAGALPWSEAYELRSSVRDETDRKASHRHRRRRVANSAGGDAVEEIEVSRQSTHNRSNEIQRHA